MDRRRSHVFLFALIIACASLSGCGGGGAVPGVTVITTSLPDGTVNQPYSALLMATGGAPPYFWILTGTTAMPPGLNWDATNGSGTISGTPTTAGTYGPYGFKVSDSNGVTAFSTGLPITINPALATTFCAPRGNEAELSSAPYAFMAKGTDSVGNPIDIAGAFTPDGQGGISNAAADYNGITNGPEQLLVNLSASSYGFGSPGEGCLHLVFAGPATTPTSARGTRTGSTFAPANVTRVRSIKAPATGASTVSSVEFRFSLGDYDGVAYHTGRIIESDGTNGSGTSVSGFMHLQTPSAFELAALKPNYAFGMDGWTPTAPGILRTVLAGTFMNRSGNLSAGYADLNAGGTASGELTDGHGALSSTIDATTGRGTGSFSIATPSGDLSFDFVFYVLNGSDLILLSSDSAMANTATPLLAGRALASKAAYSSASLSGYYLWASQGLVVMGGTIGNAAAIGTMNATGTGAIPTATMYSNLAGSYSSNQYSDNSYTVEVASARVSVTGVTGMPQVMYLTSGSADDRIAGLLVGTDTEASSGEILRQSASLPSYVLANVSGNYAASEAEAVDGLNGAFLTSFTFTGKGG
jgi:hypothetical protein